MEEWLTQFVSQLPLILLFVIIGVSILVLVKGADILVDQAVSLSVRWGVPKLLIGATIVSVGTTLPEAAVSVLAAVKGAPGLALGNAVGSIIADTGLILGLAALIGKVPVEKKIVSRQSWIQVGSAFLLIAVSIPYTSVDTMFSNGGRIPQAAGIGLLILLALYIWRSISWSKEAPADETAEEVHEAKRPIISMIELVFGVAMVIIGSRILIPAVEETAVRLHIPDAIIAATLVAFGTSLPELVTSITAVRKGHGELAIGNVLGADVLNVLFVTGAAAAVTPGGLEVPSEFFIIYFPSMIFVITILRIGIGKTTHLFSRRFALILLAAYLVTVMLGYLL